MAVRSLSSLPAVRFEASKSNGALPPRRNPEARPRLSLSKPSWVVRTEARMDMWHVFLMLCVFNFWIMRCLLQSNVHREVRKKPDPPCEVCTGSGRVNCHDCCGRVLPSSECAPINCFNHSCRCRTCGGSGLGYCSRCLGTGEYRYIMGFQFMKMNSSHSRDDKNEAQCKQDRRSAADFYKG
ncbi:hypothetical protein DVH24_025812 [Malus domestica]|uniref:Uncharacterized protein n=1 Tax=Malus domestica TaxID=3750 RepID=A0A498KH16_MALDO|nr:hypothetical protein DVH24_025812 [Malus domestica]